MPRAWVMVLGDVGRSPRMQYHASSLCKTVSCCTAKHAFHAQLPPLPPAAALLLLPLQNCSHPALQFGPPSLSGSHILLQSLCSNSSIACPTARLRGDPHWLPWGGTC